MTSRIHPPSAEDSQTETVFDIHRSRAGLELLRQAYLYAMDAGVDYWDFALEIDRLYEAGLTINDLRWLVAKGFAEHGRETSVYGDTHRSFRRSTGFNFEDSTCVILTACGKAMANRISTGMVRHQQSVRSVDMSPAAVPESDVSQRIPLSQFQTNGLNADAKPHWDAMRRELRIADVVVKRFRVPARNQELILRAFEEENWPPHIDDPLPVSETISPQTRLHDAINRLNRHQTNRLIRFQGNGRGTGISWKLRKPD